MARSSPGGEAPPPAMLLPTTPADTCDEYPYNYGPFGTNQTCGIRNCAMHGPSHLSQTSIVEDFVNFMRQIGVRRGGEAPPPAMLLPTTPADTCDTKP